MTEGAGGEAPPRRFDRASLLAAFDRLGRAAAANGAMLDLLVYGGSALMLASNFRFATEDVDIARLEHPWPEWLSREVVALARENGWAEDWLSEAVDFHLSPLASRSADHHEFGTFPREGAPGLRVSVPSAEYLLALKLKAMRINDPAKGAMEAGDIRALVRLLRLPDAEAAIAVPARFFPSSARDADRQRFLLRHIWPSLTETHGDEPPRYPR